MINALIEKQKRKRSPSPSPTMKNTDDETAPAAADSTPIDLDTKRKAALDKIAKDLLVVLQEHDITPSILTATIPSPSIADADGPPIKRAKLSSSPTTIAERLASGTYTTPTALISDIATVCKAIDAPGTANFEVFARDIVIRECQRRPNLFNASQLPKAEAPEKLALMVMAHHGPLFSSLQGASDVATEALSRSSSDGGGESPSTAPTSTCASPKTVPNKVMRVVAPLNEVNLPPLISTVKAASSPLKIDEKVPTLGEAFPPVRISSLAPPKPGAIAAAGMGLKWGGAIGPGGASAPNPAARPEPTGEWLLYKNHPPKTAKWKALARGEPIRQGMGLPADFVAAYSSFAPTRDDAGAKVPSGVRNRVWWEKVGKGLFRQTFGDHPGVGHMYKEFSVTERTDGDVEMVEAEPEEDESEIFRKAVENFEPDTEIPIDFRLLESGGDADADADSEKKKVNEPIAGLDPDETLKEISNLLKRLQSHQYVRLSTAPALPAPRISTSSATPAPPAPSVADTPHTPTPEEITLYNDIQTRLAYLISTLPPHTTITADGTPDAPLTVSSLIPLSSGTPVYSGTLPSTPTPVQPAAIAALNAAVGMSPSAPSPSPAPIAMMSRPVNVPAPLPPRLAGAPNVQTYYQQPSQQQYHGHQLPASTQPHHYPSPYAPPPPRVVSPGIQRVGQPMFHTHSIPNSAPRRTTPAPMGLAAIGAGYATGVGYASVGGPVVGGGGMVQGGVQVVGGQMVGRDGLRMGVQHTQASMENGTVPGGRYAGRSRR